MTEAYNFLIKKIPEHIVEQYIVPFTIEKKDPNMLIDIRSYTADLDLVYNYYHLNENTDIIDRHNDLYLLYRNLASFTYQSVIYVPFNNSFPECTREIRKMWGKMSPKQRTMFVNQFIISDYDSDYDSEILSNHNFIQDTTWY